MAFHRNVASPAAAARDAFGRDDLDLGREFALDRPRLEAGQRLAGSQDLDKTMAAAIVARRRHFRARRIGLVFPVDIQPAVDPAGQNADSVPSSALAMKDAPSELGVGLASGQDLIPPVISSTFNRYPTPCSVRRYSGRLGLRSSFFRKFAMKTRT